MDQVFLLGVWENQRVRVSDDRKTASILDLLRAVLNVDNPSKSWLDVQHLCNETAQLHQFRGARQRKTPVVTVHQAERIIAHALAGARLNTEAKQQISSRLNLQQSNPMLYRVYIEEEVLASITTAFAFLSPCRQFSIPPLRYHIDLYFPQQKVAVECDEHGHAGYCREAEVRRVNDITNVLGCLWYRFNPHAEHFDVFVCIHDLMKLLTSPQSR